MMMLKEGAMAGIMHLSVDGSWRAREKAKALLLLLRDCKNGGSSSSRVRHSKNLMMEEVMRQIDRGERGGASSVQMVEEMIAKLRT